MQLGWGALWELSDDHSDTPCYNNRIAEEKGDVLANLLLRPKSEGTRVVCAKLVCIIALWASGVRVTSNKLVICRFGRMQLHLAGIIGA